MYRPLLVAASLTLSFVACTREPAAGTTATSSTPVPTVTPTPTVTSTPIPTPKVLSTGEVEIGKAPPDFSAKSHDGADVHLAALKGKPVVVYFYPKDETPGCTKEACSFRDAWDGLQKKGVVLIGVSGDTDASHKAFAEHHKLPFVLVSDPNGDLCKAYGVPFKAGYAGRQSFVIGADGNVKKIYRQVDVTVHAQQIAADIAQ